MIGVLNSAQIDNLLSSQVTGRIGCSYRGKTYVVPFTFVFDGNYIYGHSHEGEKIRMMRKNPNVCFQTDVIENMCNWRSVIAWGVYEEMKEMKDHIRAMKIFGDRLAPFVTSQSAEPHYDRNPAIKQKRSISFRIRITEKSGRFEKRV